MVDCTKQAHKAHINDLLKAQQRSIIANGRLREGPGGKLLVECTGEGVVFIEADAVVSLEQFGHTIHPPFLCMDELLYDVPGFGEMLNCPLLLIQITCAQFFFLISTD
ncbi:hypothetical protein SO802_023880 [Lithocarpus litseifolius]|uniref:Uncharacterized protein n=1 Tax=Lithocarpus litseifolius TaxID=425828 RepID=A0AAW2C9G0_9ROSI